MSALFGQNSENPEAKTYVQVFDAHYREVSTPAHKGNPLIETLPPLYTRAEVSALLQRLPPYDDSDRSLSVQERLQLLTAVPAFFQPLPQHLDLAETMSTMIRNGYVGRNPVRPEYFPSARRRLPSVLEYRPDSTEELLAMLGLTLIGESGIGKSRGVSRVLRLYPQVIRHSMYNGQPFSHLQIVYLQIGCPHDGSRKSLCKEFFRAVDRCLGTSYFERYVENGRASVDSLIIYMGNICLLHHIGVLVIDEIQNLREAKAPDVAKMLNFFTQLDNTINVPVVLIGTPRARPILTGGFRRARRAEGRGGLIWERMKPGKQWDLFVSTLWKYQYTRNLCELTPELSRTLWDESQGVADIAIKIFQLAQERAIIRNWDHITAARIKAIARKKLYFVQRFLTALRTGDNERLATDPSFDDLFPVWPLRAHTNSDEPPDDDDRSDDTKGTDKQSTTPPPATDTAPGDAAQPDSSVDSPTLPDHSSEITSETAAETQQDPVATREPESSGRSISPSQTGSKEERAPDAQTEKRQRGADSTKPARPKIALLQAFDTKTPSASPYEALRTAGYMRPISEYVPEDHDEQAISATKTGQ